MRNDMARISIATKGSYKPKCIACEDQSDTTEAVVEYKLLTSQQVEEYASSGNKCDWAKIWRNQVTSLQGCSFEVDGKETQLTPKDIPDYPQMYLLYTETAQHILKESIVSREIKN